jgi:hypothetical protein
MVASEAPITAAKLRAASRGLPRELANISAIEASRLGPRLDGGSVYTDDRAPVEWLVDKSLLGYASDR